MDRPTLYIFVGYPGAGKTSVAKLIAQRTGAVHLWADHIRRERFTTPNHSAAESKQLYEHLNVETGTLLASGSSVIFDTNFNFYADRQLLRQIAARHHAKLVLIWVTTDQALSRQRAVTHSHGQATRIYGNMTDADFERIAGNLQPPHNDEQPVRIDGSQLDAEQLYRTLHI